MPRRLKRKHSFGQPLSLQDLKRQARLRPPRASILIVCEDAKSAPSYFTSLCDRLNVSTVEVEVVTGEECGSEPKNVVAHAIGRRKERTKQAKHSVSKTEFDEIWCVFDRETPGSRPDYDTAVARAREARLKIAPSNPCFEYWILLHFEDTCRPFDDCKAVITYLKAKHFSTYAKGENCFPHLENCVDDAVLRAEKCVKIKGAGPPLPNPATLVHDLVKRIKKIAALPYDK